MITVKNNVAYFCLTHTVPLFNVPNFYNILLTSSKNILDSSFNILSIKDYVDTRKELKPINNFYPDYFFVFLNDYFKKTKLCCEYICISMHRKIVTRASIGSPTSNFHGMNLSNEKYLPINLLTFDKKTNFLLCKPLEFQDGVKGQYYRKHCKNDFDKFANMLIPSGVFSEIEMEFFLNQKILVPAAPLGVVPYDVFVYIAEKIGDFLIIYFAPKKSAGLVLIFALP